MSECQNSDDSARWIQAARTNTGQCPTITVSPEQYVVDSSQTVMQLSCVPSQFFYVHIFLSDQIVLTVSQDLPMLQENETYL